MSGDLQVFPDADALAHGVADFLLTRASAATAGFAVALSGGSTPKPAYELLGQEPYIGRFPWSRTSWFWGDERFVPPEDPASNYGMALHAFLSRAPVPAQNVHPILTERMTPREAAKSYEAVLRAQYGSANLDPARPLFDVALQGIGPDGHTASLIPGQPVLEERARWVAEVVHGREETRITLTYPVLESSRVVLFVVSGAGKRDILRQVINRTADVPAARLQPVGKILFFADRDAAG